MTEAGNVSNATKDEHFDLPVFTGTMQEPEPVTYEVAASAFEEIIAAFKLRENTPRVTEDIPEFKM